MIPQVPRPAMPPVQPSQTATAVPPQPEQKLLPGPKILLVGDTGSGKTHAIRTLIDAGMQVAVIFTEPGMEVIADIPCEKGMHYAYIAPAASSWDDLSASAKKINSMTYKLLCGLEGIQKQQYGQYLDFLHKCKNFTCDRCGKTFGSIDEFDPATWAVVVDSFSGVSMMGMNLMVGGKPVRDKSDYGVAQDNLERFLIKFTTALPCTGILTAHLEPERDEVTGMVMMMASTIGQKLAPKIPRNFSDVIHCRRNGTSFIWSTASPNVSTKARNVPIAENLPPSFVPIIKTWKAKAGITS